MATLVCQPCQNDDVSVEAAGYCVDCAEYLCITCYKYHRKPQPCRHHVLLDKESMPQQPAQHGQTKTCVKHKGKALEYFCNNHDCIGCSVCMTLEHTTCEGKSYIPDIATSIPDSDEYKELQTSINRLMSSADEQIKGLKNSLLDTENVRDSVLADILCFRGKLEEAIDMLENVVRDEVDILTDKATKDRLEQIKHISDIKDEIERIGTDLNMSIKYRQFLKLFIAVKSAKVMTSELTTRLNEYEKYEQVTFDFTPNLSILKLLNALETLGTVNSVRSEMASSKSAVKCSTSAVTAVTSPKRSNVKESENPNFRVQNSPINENLGDNTSSKLVGKDDFENVDTDKKAVSENELYIQNGSQRTSTPTTSKEMKNDCVDKHDSPIETFRNKESNKSGIGKYMLTYSDNEEDDDEKVKNVENEEHDDTGTPGNNTKLNTESITDTDTAIADRNYEADKVNRNEAPSSLASNLEIGQRVGHKNGHESPERSNAKLSAVSSPDKGTSYKEVTDAQSPVTSDTDPRSTTNLVCGANIKVHDETSTLGCIESAIKPTSSDEKQSIAGGNNDNKTFSDNASPKADTVSIHGITNGEDNATGNVSESIELLNKTETSGSPEKRPEMFARANLKNPKDRVVVFLKNIAVTSTEDSAIPTVCGMAALGDDRIAVCDNENKAIKLVDILTNIVVQTVRTDQSPWDLCEAGEERIAVTFPFSKQIGIYKVTESVKKDYIFNVDGGCYGVTYANENLFVAFGDTNVVKVMDLYGYVLRVLQNMRGEKPIFNNPKHITAGPEGRLFYVSNWGNDSITCLTGLGHVAGIYTDRELKAPRDVAVDSFGLVYVCNFARPSGIQVLTKGLNKVKKLLNKDKAITNPLSLAYSYKGDWLFVGIKGEYLKMYKLTV